MEFLDGRQSKKLFEKNIVISNCFIRNNFNNLEYFLRPRKLVQYFVISVYWWCFLKSTTTTGKKLINLERKSFIISTTWTVHCHCKPIINYQLAELCKHHISLFSCEDAALRVLMSKIQSFKIQETNFYNPVQQLYLMTLFNSSLESSTN